MYKLNNFSPVRSREIYEHICRQLYTHHKLMYIYTLCVVTSNTEFGYNIFVVIHTYTYDDVHMHNKITDSNPSRSQRIYTFVGIHTYTQVDTHTYITSWIMLTRNLLLRLYAGIHKYA